MTQRAKCFGQRSFSSP